MGQACKWCPRLPYAFHRQDDTRKGSWECGLAPKEEAGWQSNHRVSAARGCLLLTRSAHLSSPGSVFNARPPSPMHTSRLSLPCP